MLLLAALLPPTARLSVLPSATPSAVQSAGQNPVGAVQAADSAEIVAETRAAIRRFERTRRRHFPRGAFSRRRCQELIGRFCVWHDWQEEEAWEPTPEAEEVIAARAELVEKLARYVSALPADGWVRGQWIRYLLEADQLDRARAAAEACRSADEAWCAALRATVLHETGDFEAAERAFDHAVAAMPRDERCAWRDLEPLLEGRGRGEYGDLPCEGRDRFEQVFWLLADPSYLLPGNDRRTEHFVRHVHDRLQFGSANGFGLQWGSDMRELLIRYGRPAGWSLAWRRDPGIRTDAVVESHREPNGRHFVPRSEWVLEPLELGPDDWELRPERPRTLYAPSYARPMRDLPHQIAAFPRSNGTLIGAAWELPQDANWPCDSLISGLFLVVKGAIRPLASTRATDAWTGNLTLFVPRSVAGQVGEKNEDNRLQTADAPKTRAVVGVEVACGGGHNAARTRYGKTFALPEAEGLALSDVLVLRASGGLPDSLDEALELAFPAIRARAGERIALYWELYDRRRVDRELEMTVALEREGKGFLRRVAEWAGLADGADEAVALRWRETPVGPAIRSRSIELALPDDLPTGAYRLRLTAALAGGETLESVRALEIDG